MRPDLDVIEDRGGPPGREGRETQRSQGGRWERKDFVRQRRTWSEPCWASLQLAPGASRGWGAVCPRSSGHPAWSGAARRPPAQAERAMHNPLRPRPPSSCLGSHCSKCIPTSDRTGRPRPRSHTPWAGTGAPPSSPRRPCPHNSRQQPATLPLLAAARGGAACQRDAVAGGDELDCGAVDRLHPEMGHRMAQACRRPADPASAATGGLP